MSDTLRSILPSIYRKLLPPHFDRPTIEEPRATCDNCEMCDKGDLPEGMSALFFRPDTKCCTFHPSLPNYLVGALLRDGRPELAEGQKRVRAAIASRIGVTPRWVGPSARYQLLYEAARKSSFGRAKTLQCPYLDDGKCSVWMHRDAICSTFFCKFNGGVAGSRFWRSMKDYLTYSEAMLSRWAATTVSKDVGEPKSTPGVLLRNELEDRAPNDVTYRSYWADWVGREEEFYDQCYAQVRALTARDFARLVDQTPRGKHLLTTLMLRYDELQAKPKLPERLALHPKLRALPVHNGGVVVTTPYNPYDSFRLEAELYEALKELDLDAPLAANRERLEKEKELAFEDGLLQSLAMHYILAPPGVENGDPPPKKPEPVK